MELDSFPSSLPELSCQVPTVADQDSLTSVATTDSLEAEPQTPAEKPSSAAIFGSTFLTIFLAEFGDKTQVSTLLMSAESQSPWVVFLGSATALIATSLLGVLLGCWLANRLAPKSMQRAAGVSLLLISAVLFWEVLQ